MVYSIPDRRDHTSKRALTSRLRAAPFANKSNRRPSRFQVQPSESRSRRNTGALCIHRPGRNLQALGGPSAGFEERSCCRSHRRTHMQRRLPRTKGRIWRIVSGWLPSSVLLDVWKLSTYTQNRRATLSGAEHFSMDQRNRDVLYWNKTKPWAPSASRYIPVTSPVIFIANGTVQFELGTSKVRKLPLCSRRNPRIC